MSNPHKYIDFEPLEFDIKELIGQNLCQVRREQNMTQRNAADLMDMSLAQWKKYELGVEAMKVDSAVVWCTRTGTSMKRLFNCTAYGEKSKDGDYQRYVDKLSLPISRLNLKQYAHLCKSLQVIFSLPLVKFAVSPKELGYKSIDFSQTGLRSEYFGSISRGLRIYRHTHGIAQSQLADYLSVSGSSYKKYESEQDVTRFSVIFAARFAVLSQRNPLFLVQNTKVGFVREQQDSRLLHFLKLVDSIGSDKIDVVESIVQKMVLHVPSMRIL